MVLKAFWSDVEWGNNAIIILLVDFMVLEVHGVVAVTLVKSPFLELGLIDGLYYNNNTLPSTVDKLNA
jgi:hypothetical protein